MAHWPSHRRIHEIGSVTHMHRTQLQRDEILDSSTQQIARLPAEESRYGGVGEGDPSVGTNEEDAIGRYIDEGSE